VYDKMHKSCIFKVQPIIIYYKTFNQMEKQARIDSILRMIESKLHTYIDEQSETTDPIEYEDRLLELGNQVMLKKNPDSIGTR